VHPGTFGGPKHTGTVPAHTVTHSFDWVICLRPPNQAEKQALQQCARCCQQVASILWHSKPVISHRPLVLNARCRVVDRLLVGWHPKVCCPGSDWHLTIMMHDACPPALTTGCVPPWPLQLITACRDHLPKARFTSSTEPSCIAWLQREGVQQLVVTNHEGRLNLQWLRAATSTRSTHLVGLSLFIALLEWGEGKVTHAATCPSGHAAVPSAAVECRIIVPDVAESVLQHHLYLPCPHLLPLITGRVAECSLHE
jgi:hypothetical protein